MKTHLNDLFDQLEPEKGNKLDDKIQIKESELLEIIKLYENFVSNHKEFLPIYNNHERIYYKMNEKEIPHVKGRNIEGFAKLLKKDFIRKNFNCNNITGMYLSSLINNCIDEKVNLDLRNKGIYIYISIT